MLGVDNSASSKSWKGYDSGRIPEDLLEEAGVQCLAVLGFKGGQVWFDGEDNKQDHAVAQSRSNSLQQVIALDLALSI